MQHGYKHAAWTWTHRLRPAAWTWTCSMDTDIQQEHEHTTRIINMDMQHGQVNAACPVHAHAACTCPCCMSNPARTACPLGSSDFDKIFENCFASCSFGMAKDI